MANESSRASRLSSMELELELMGSFFVQQLEVTDLSYWEFINVGDADSGSDLDDVLSWHSSVSSIHHPLSPAAENLDQDPLVPAVFVDEKLALEQPQTLDAGLFVPDVLPVEKPAHHNKRYEVKVDYDHDEYDEYGCLDDELVPWQVGGKLGRQRMRKLGKRMFTKMANSKRSPHLFMKPGCVYGKHGLGLKHSF